MSNLCTDCGVKLTEKPFYEGVVGGDWFTACSVCGWHSEDENKTVINLNPTKNEIVCLKIRIDEVRQQLFNILYKKYDSWGNRYNIPYEYNNMIEEVMDKVTAIGESMLIEDKWDWDNISNKPYKPATESIINDGDEV
mgnify:FL=1